MGYIASLVLLIGQWLIGSKNKWGFICLMFGNLVWTFISFQKGMYDLSIIAVANTIVSTVNFIRWRISDHRNSVGAKNALTADSPKL